jgi:3-isopropylmalate dehydrogenase
MKLRVTVLPGDGVGPEVTAQAVNCLRSIGEIGGYDFSFHQHSIGGDAIRRFGTPLPPATLEACLESDAVLLGAVGSPEFDALAPNARPEYGLLTLRKALGGFANLRPAISRASIAHCSPLQRSVVEGADILVVRELLGGIYFGEPRGNGGTEAHNTMRYSEFEIERVARVAFEQARARRRKVTSVDKANVLETSQLWRKVVTRIGKEFPDVALEHMYVDACAMHLMMNPRRFDVILTENLFGDILTDEAAVITGSLGMLASATIGGEVDLYEPVHGSAPDIAGRNIANPIGAIWSAALLLRYTAQLEAEAAALEGAIWQILQDSHYTPDLQRNQQWPALTTKEMGALIENAAADQLNRRYAYHAV